MEKIPTVKEEQQRVRIAVLEDSVRGLLTVLKCINEREVNMWTEDETNPVIANATAALEGAAPPPLTFGVFSEISLQRSLRWHKGGIEEWSEAEWTNAMGGEAGEAAAAMVTFLTRQLSTAVTALTMLGHAGESMNAGKKLLRLMKGNQQHAGDSAVPTNIEEARTKVAKEIGDTISYCDLVCHRIGWTLEDALKLAFNSVSVREGFPERL